MSMQKKNVIKEFLQDDYLPTKEQQIVKYLQGRGNNLHSVEDYKGNEFLVSMPKKYRQTVWLQKGNCLVIDPVVEGKKVKGEILCLVSAQNVIELITSDKWPYTESHNDDNKTEDVEKVKNEYLIFFKKNEKPIREVSPPPTSSSSSEYSESESDQEDEKKVQSEVHIQVDRQNGSSISNGSITLMSSNGITVTTAETQDSNQYESFEFGAEGDSSEETNAATDVSRLVNAIRIRVSYPNPQSADKQEISTTSTVCPDSSNLT